MKNLSDPSREISEPEGGEPGEDVAPATSTEEER